jgi:hypothetical protein
VDLDFSADWQANEPNEPNEETAPQEAVRARIADFSQGVRPSLAKGLRIVEDPEALQVVVDPYQSLDDEELEDEELDNEELDEARDEGRAPTRDPVPVPSTQGPPVVGKDKHKM